MGVWRKKSSEWRESAKRFKDRVPDFRLGAHKAAHGVVDGMINVATSPWRAFKVVCFSLGAATLVLSLVALISVYGYLKSLPNMSMLKFRDLKLIAQGKLQNKIQDPKHLYRWVSLDDISREYLYSIVASEDATFFEHSGFNFEAMANSLAENIKEQKIAYGGSTISQQVVKNLFLSSERTVSRKIKEFLITRELEARFSKNEILELYLNLAELGPDIYGVNAAAWTYFRKAPKKVNAAEGTFIALMLPSPKRHYYTIYQNRNLTRQKRRKIERVLRDMLYEEYLTEKQYREYVQWDYFKGTPDTRLPARSREE